MNCAIVLRVIQVSIVQVLLKAMIVSREKNRVTRSKMSFGRVSYRVVIGVSYRISVIVLVCFVFVAVGGGVRFSIAVVLVIRVFAVLRLLFLLATFGMWVWRFSYLVSVVVVMTVGNGTFSVVTVRKSVVVTVCSVGAPSVWWLTCIIVRIMTVSIVVPSLKNSFVMTLMLFYSIQMTDSVSTDSVLGRMNSLLVISVFCILRTS